MAGDHVNRDGFMAHLLISGILLRYIKQMALLVEARKIAKIGRRFHQVLYKSRVLFACTYPIRLSVVRLARPLIC